MVDNHNVFCIDLWFLNFPFFNFIVHLFTMANFDEVAMLFAINNVNLHEELVNNDNVRQTRNKATISDPFNLSDQLFVKNFRLFKDLI